MNKKFLAAGAGLAVLALSATFVLSMGKTSLATLADPVTHSHGSSCIIHHYAQVDPTSEKSGVKEYWICCSDPTHTVSYTNPGVGDITDATHGDDFSIDSTDGRYIAPYTFPEVFSSQMAYATPVTISDDGKVTSSTGTIEIKASVLKDAYTHGYTHMKFHSNAESSDVTNILGIQTPTWRSYYKRYKNDQDNRYWLKSFSDSNQNLNINSLNQGTHVDNNLSLSDFTLFKSPLTESWAGEESAANRYIAFENGELVMDNCGGGQGNWAGVIPAEYWLSGWSESVYDRAFYVKKLAKGGYQDSTADKGYEEIIVKDASGNACDYRLARLDGDAGGTGDKEDKTSDGFSNLLYKGYAAGFGLHAKYYYTAGDFPIKFNEPSAYAIRFNYHINPTNTMPSTLSYKIVPQAMSSDGKYRVSLTNISSAQYNQSNLDFIGSSGHKGIDIKITSTVKMAGSNGNYMRFMPEDFSSNLAWPGAEQALVDGVYTWSKSITFKETNPGCCLIFLLDEACTDGTMNLEYSWID